MGVVLQLWAGVDFSLGDKCFPNMSIRLENKLLLTDNSIQC